MSNQHHEGTSIPTGALMPAAGELARALRVNRIARGLSLRTLARRVGMSAHSGLADYERGHRILPEDLAIACERALELPPGYLLALRRRALAEQAERRYPRTGRFPRQPNGSASAAAAHLGLGATAGPGAPGDVAGGTPAFRSPWAEDLNAVAADVRHLAATVGTLSLRVAATVRCWLADHPWSRSQPFPDPGGAGSVEEPYGVAATEDPASAADPAG